MRKIAVVAILAIVAAMVPASIASSQPTPGSLDGVGTLMIINNGFVFGPLDLWIKIDGNFQKLDLADTSQTEFQIPQGDHSFQVCASNSTTATCDGGATSVGAAPGSVHVGSNDIINFLVDLASGGADYVYFAQNSTDKTETDHAQATLFNALPGTSIDICVGDDHVISSPGGPDRQIASFPSLDGETRVVRIYIGFFASCGGPNLTATTNLGFPSGSNTVLNITADADCTGDCGYQIFPGEEPPATSQQVQAFCDVVLQAANITPWLQALFSEVEVGNADTYPSPERVEKVITRIAELLEKGNQTAPDAIRKAWLSATAAFVETGRLAALDYDIRELPQDSLRDLVDGVEHPGADDSEEAAVTAELTAWVTTNCFGAVTAEPSFTG